jgi:RNA polymerase sigma-70 factor (ECF subfamily)
VQGSAPTGEIDAARRRAVVDAFLAAARGGDFQALLKLMMPDAVVRADEIAVKLGADNKFGVVREVRGAEAIARMFSGRAAAARLAMVGGQLGLVWAPGGKVRAAFNFTLEDDRISAVELIADPERIQQLGVTILNA